VLSFFIFFLCFETGVTEIIFFFVAESWHESSLAAYHAIPRDAFLMLQVSARKQQKNGMNQKKKRCLN
jgi:hypothetical protein